MSDQWYCKHCHATHDNLSICPLNDEELDGFTQALIDFSQAAIFIAPTSVPLTYTPQPEEKVVIHQSFLP